MSRNLNINIIDVHKELFEKHKDPLSLFPFREESHYSEEGYRLISKKIYEKIKEIEK